MTIPHFPPLYSVLLIAPQKKRKQHLDGKNVPGWCRVETKGVFP